MKARNVVIGLVVFLALVGGGIALTSGQNRAPVVVASPTPTVIPATPSPTVAPTATPTSAPTLAPTPVPSPTVATYTISGKITNARTGQEVPRVIVRAFDAIKYCGGSPGGTVPSSGNAVSGQDGTFRVVVPAGSYWIITTASGYQDTFAATCERPAKADRDLTINVSLIPR